MYYSTTQTIYINKYINNHMCLEICLHSLGYLYENFISVFHYLSQRVSAGAPLAGSLLAPICGFIKT